MPDPKDFTMDDHESEQQPETVELDIPSGPLDIVLEGPLEVFVSCGGLPFERGAGEWLHESLRRTANVQPFLWERESPGADPTKSLQQRLLERSRSSDAVVAFLHYRGEPGEHPFSLSCYDEISSAMQSGIPTLVFRTPGVKLSGMILRQIETREIRRVSQVVPIISSWLPTVMPRDGKVRLAMLKWGRLQVNPVDFSSRQVLVFGPQPPPRKMFVTVANVVNEGSIAARGAKAWIQVGSRWFQLPWSIPNADGSRQTKDLNPGDEESFEVCAWRTWDMTRVMPVEHGWPENPRHLGDESRGTIKVKLKVTTLEGTILGPRTAEVSPIIEVSESASTPLLSWH